MTAKEILPEGVLRIISAWPTMEAARVHVMNVMKQPIPEDLQTAEGILAWVEKQWPETLKVSGAQEFNLSITGRQEVTTTMVARAYRQLDWRVRITNDELRSIARAVGTTRFLAAVRELAQEKLENGHYDVFLNHQEIVDLDYNTPPFSEWEECEDGEKSYHLDHEQAIPLAAHVASMGDIFTNYGQGLVALYENENQNDEIIDDEGEEVTEEEGEGDNDEAR